MVTELISPAIEMPPSRDLIVTILQSFRSKESINASVNNHHAKDVFESFCIDHCAVELDQTRTSKIFVTNAASSSRDRGIRLLRFVGQLHVESTSEVEYPNIASQTTIEGILACSAGWKGQYGCTQSVLRVESYD